MLDEQLVSFPACLICYVEVLWFLVIHSRLRLVVQQNHVVDLRTWPVGGVRARVGSRPIYMIIIMMASILWTIFRFIDDESLLDKEELCWLVCCFQHTSFSEDTSRVTPALLLMEG